MQLVERREFSLDTPIAKQLPESLDSYEPYPESASELVRDPAWQIVTPRMLLAHTSGLANFAFIEPDKKMRLHFKPGSRYRYSREGINLVQFVIDQQKRWPLDQVMQEALFTPLGMTRTGIIYRTEFAANMADCMKRFPARAARFYDDERGRSRPLRIDAFTGKILKPSTRKAAHTFRARFLQGGAWRRRAELT